MSSFAFCCMSLIQGTTLYNDTSTPFWGDLYPNGQHTIYTPKCSMTAMSAECFFIFQKGQNKNMCPHAFLKAKADGNMIRYKISTYMNVTVKYATFT